MAVWAPRTIAALGSVADLCPNTDGSVIVARGFVSGTTAGMARSTDLGLTWQAVTTNVLNSTGVGQLPTFHPTIAWSESLGLFVTAGAYGAQTGWRIASSPDGDVWTTREQNVLASISYIDVKVVWAEALGLFIMIGATAAGGPVSAFHRTSPDGIVWTTRATGATTYIGGLAWSDDLGIGVANGFLAGGYAAPAMSTTTDGITLTNMPTPIAGDAGIEGGFGSGDTTWSQHFGAFFSIAFDTTPGEYVVLKSVDGTTWTKHVTGTEFLGIGNLYNGRVAVGGQSGPSRVLFITADGGTTWPVDAVLPSLTAFPFAIVSFNNAAANVNMMAATASGGFKILSQQQTLAAAGTGDPPTLWKFFIAELDGTGITEYSKLASARSVELALNQPLKVSGTVPSDNTLVNLPYPNPLGSLFGGDDSYLSEGIRLLWAFRKESDTPPYYTVRGATLVQLVEDAAEQDDARTSFVGYDPWQLLLSRPVVNSDGDLPGVFGMSFSNTLPTTIIGNLLKWTIAATGHAYIDGSLAFGGTTFYAGTIETGTVTIDINFPRGTTVGEAWRMVCDLGVCDIVLNPIYDPFNRPDYLVELNVYNQAGTTRDEQRFAWNQPGRSLVGLNRQIDGTVRANEVTFGAGYAGTNTPTITPTTDVDSIAKFGVYYANQMFPAALSAAAVSPLQDQQLALRKGGRTTVSFRPAPERSPEPWVDYQLGDRVPVFASREKFRYPLTSDPLGASTGYQRIYGWRADIADDALETVTVLVSQEGQQ